MPLIRKIAFAFRPHEKAYEWLTSRIATDADCRRVFKTIITRVPGSSNDDNDPSPGLCPWVRLSPSIESQYPIQTWGSRVISESVMAVRVETAISGFAVGEHMNLWAILWDLLMGTKYNAGCISGHRAAYINHYTLDQPTSVETVTPSSGTGLVLGAGAIRLYIRA